MKIKLHFSLAAPCCSIYSTCKSKLSNWMSKKSCLSFFSDSLYEKNWLALHTWVVSLILRGWQGGHRNFFFGFLYEFITHWNWNLEQSSEGLLFFALIKKIFLQPLVEIFYRYHKKEEKWKFYIWSVGYQNRVKRMRGVHFWRNFWKIFKNEEFGLKFF